MSRTITVAVIAIVISTGACGGAKASAARADENAQLKDRVETLEKQIQELTGTPSAAGKKPMWSKLDVQFYGFIKGDAAYDNSRTNSGNYVLYVDR